MDAGKEYYDWGKESSPTLARTIEWLSPKVEPILESAKPLLLFADSLGCNALDWVESIQSKYETLEYKTRHTSRASVDEFLNDRLLIRPINFALDMTEKVADCYLLDEDSHMEKYFHGPISKSFYLWRRIARRAPQKFSGNIAGISYVVDLIKYAAEILDDGVGIFNQPVHETPKDIKWKVQVLTLEAVRAICTALDLISLHIPNGFSGKVPNSTDVGLFSSVAAASAKILHEMSGNMGDFVERGEDIPKPILHFTIESLQHVISDLFALEEPLR